MRHSGWERGLSQMLSVAGSASALARGESPGCALGLSRIPLPAGSEVRGAQTSGSLLGRGKQSDIQEL